MRGFALQVAILSGLAISSATRAAEAPTAAQRWQALAPGEKRALAEGIAAGSRMSLETYQRHAKLGLASVSADPSWIADPLRREAYTARLTWSGNEMLKKGWQRSELSGKAEPAVAVLDQFYAEPRNARIDPAAALWLVRFGASDDERKWPMLKVQAYRAYEALRWLDATRQRDSIRPTWAWDRTVGTGPFGTAPRPDGRAETYYSLDPYYAAALLRVQDEVAPKNKQLHLTWHLARWQEMNYRPMAEAYRRTWHSKGSRRDSTTGLLETKAGGLAARGVKGQLPPRVHDLEEALWAVETLHALPDDAEVRTNCLAYLDAVWQRHWVDGQGLYGLVNLDGGARLDPQVKINTYGRWGTGLAEVYHVTRDEKWRDRVQALNQLVWQRRRNPQRAYVPLYIDAENPEFSYNVEAQVSAKAAGWSDDSDSIYYIRDVFRQHELTGLPLLKEIVVRHGRDYIAAAWLGDEVGHFTRHWWVDAVPLSQRMYGDGRFNSNYQMAIAAALADTPSDKRYFLDFLDKQLATFRRLDSVAGLYGMQFLEGGRVVPEYGYNMDDLGICGSQEVYCDILLAAYEAEGDQKYLAAAKELMQRMLAVGPSYWNPRNASFPAVAVRLARHCGPPARVEIPLNRKGATLRLSKAGTEVFHAVVPTEVAVIYAPAGDYEAEVQQGPQVERRRIVAR